MNPLLQLQNIQVQLGGRLILSGVSTGIRRGSMTALIGLNGSGKTTLLRAILGETRFNGTLTWRGPAGEPLPTPRIGYVPQRLTLDSRLPITVTDFLAISLQSWPILFGVRPQTRVMIDQILTQMGIPHLAKTQVARLSGGELQRVLLGLALTPHPDLLLLDEPAAGIDFRDQQRFYELIAEMNQSLGITVLLVSHELEIVGKHAHQVLCLRNGRIQQEGSPAEVLSQANLELLFGHGRILLPQPNNSGNTI
ncbi:metal ABC transporter ATP-binding protein [Tuwongella immobilis]|uniref:ABC transporter domain-containing protein n=1 Tax=Tuwongella immobilis TaxID=692036 RepID=A0A6C2YTI2_9BACT|nr:metal ABC transporter ATP-binding protein [Tuwongella immobilis]VIP04339.1 abc transporter atp-binding protein : Zinc transport system ATP-binding protein OS=uncultured planctomycete GN=HGMM_F33C03C09 PE=3 SV=1: ABC_tran [Tuwongella immobilis]VTS06040.1 abc transporter atp-binding protein : Zinc transport system ATP-binding protein OS=uncultured planctomycete GN=HGMM_F33C03C09 PE=3 SV=1: ABC_tran [Tuwongella immobilis]